MDVTHQHPAARAWDLTPGDTFHGRAIVAVHGARASVRTHGLHEGDDVDLDRLRAEVMGAAARNRPRPRSFPAPRPPRAAAPPGTG